MAIATLADEMNQTISQHVPLAAQQRAVIWRDSAAIRTRAGAQTQKLDWKKEVKQSRFHCLLQILGWKK